CTSKDGLFDDVIYQILEDNKGNLWFGGSKGIFRVSKAELFQFASGQVCSISSVSYGTADGMKIRECSGGGHPAAWKTLDGRLWFSTLKGLAVIQPDAIKLNEAPPPVAIEQVLVDGKRINAGGDIVLPPGQASIAFEYAGLSFPAPEKVRFKYKLEGFDRDWVDAAGRRIGY